MMVVILWRSLSLGDNHNLSLNQFAIQSNNNNGNPEKVSKFSFTNIILSTWVYSNSPALLFQQRPNTNSNEDKNPSGGREKERESEKSHLRFRFFTYQNSIHSMHTEYDKSPNVIPIATINPLIQSLTRAFTLLTIHTRQQPHTHTRTEAREKKTKIVFILSWWPTYKTLTYPQIYSSIFYSIRNTYVIMHAHTYAAHRFTFVTYTHKHTEPLLFYRRRSRYTMNSNMNHFAYNVVFVSIVSLYLNAFDCKTQSQFRKW